MPIPQLPGSGLNSLDDVVNYVIRLERELRFLMESGLDSTNMFEVGGWRVTPTQIASIDNDVGMSTADTGIDDIRFFAGTKFKVTKSGILYAVDGNFSGSITGSIITGGTFRTAEPGNKRIEITGGILKGYFSDDLLHGLVFNPNSPTNFFDMFLYHDGTQLLEFYDEGTSIKLRPGSGASIWTLGKVGGTTYVDGQWVFNSTASLDLGPNTATGRVQYANQADSAISASSASSVDWANVTNHPDATTLPVVDGTAAIGASTKYAKADHVHPTDTSRQATITGAATTITGSNLTASRALASDSSGKVAVSAVTSAEQGYLSGVTSAIQTQLNSKAPLANYVVANSSGNKIQVGSGSIVLGANGQGTVTLTFGSAFTTPPSATVGLNGVGSALNGTYCSVFSVSTTQIQIIVYTVTAQTVFVSYTAVGT